MGRHGFVGLRAGQCRPPLPVLAIDKPGTAREDQSVALMGFLIGRVLSFDPVAHRGIITSITTAALPAVTAPGHRHTQGH